MEPEGREYIQAPQQTGTTEKAGTGFQCTPLGVSLHEMATQLGSALLPSGTVFSFQITKREPDWPKSENILIPSSNSGGQVA